MLITLRLDWHYDHSYTDPDDSRISGDIYYAEKWEFDTVTRTVVHTEPPNAGYYDFYTGEQGNIDPPQDEGLDPATEFFVYVSGATRTGYFHDGAGGYTTDVQTLTLSYTITGCGCFGTNTGGIDLEASGLSGPFHYLWDDGFTQQDRPLVPAGMYRVAVTDVPSGAVARASIQVGTNPELTVVIEKVGPDVHLRVSGGSGLYAFLWNDGVTDRDRLGLASGSYSCLISDALGCSKEIEVLINANQFFFSRNPITLALDAGDLYRLDPSTKPNLTFLCEVLVERDYLSGVFEQVGTVLEQPADRLGRTVFEVQNLLDGFLQHHVPAVGATGVVRADPMFRRFYLQYAESFGAGTPVRASTSVLQQNYVLLGGLNFYESRARTFFDSYLGAVQPFLTWEPPVKSVLADQPEFLYYLVQRSPAGFHVHVRVRYTDNTEDLLFNPGASTVQLNEVYCLAVGYQALGLAALAGAERRVQWWEVSVTSPDDASVLSEVRRFVLDQRTFPHRRYFLFATSLGGMATYAATGEALLDVEVSGEEAARPLRPDYDPLLGDTVVQQRVLRPVLKVASGVRTRAQQIAAQDLLLSRRVLLLNGPRWLPGYIKVKNGTLLDESKAVPTQEFDFYLTAEQLYTPRLGLSQVTSTTSEQP